MSALRPSRITRSAASSSWMRTAAAAASSRRPTSRSLYRRRPARLSARSPSPRAPRPQQLQRPKRADLRSTRVGCKLPEGRRVDLVHHQELARVLRDEGPAARDEFKEDDAERVEIAVDNPSLVGRREPVFTATRFPIWACSPK